MYKGQIKQLLPEHLLFCLLLALQLLLPASARAGDAPDAASNSEEGAKPAKPTKVYQYRVGNTLTFSDIPPRKGPYIIWRPSCFACSLTSNIDWHTMRLNMKAFTPYIESAAQQHQVDPALVRAVIHAESNFNPHARSHKGASGLMQLMPGTAHAVGVHDVWAPESNIFGGTSYLSGLLKRFGGNIDFAVAAYNAGPGAVDKYAGIPPYAETKVYVQRVRILYQRYREQR